MARITKLEAENFKRLRAITVELEPGINEISGKNGAGKSSALDAILAALGGKNALPDEPLRRGEKAGRIEVTLDEPKILIRRTFSEDGHSTLTVESREGAQFPSPQRMLDALYGKLAFDPQAFQKMSPAERVELLLSIIDLKADLATLERLAPQSAIADPIARLAARFKRLYEDRTVQNRVAEQAEAELRAVPVPEEDDPPSTVNVSALVKERDELLAQYRAKDAGLKAAGAAKANAAANRAEAARLIREAEILEEAAAAEEAKSSDLGELLAPISQLEERIESAEAVNERYAMGVKRRGLVDRAKAERTVAVEMTTLLDDIRAYKEKLVADAKMPIAGLSFSAGDVTFNGVPFAQASQAEQIRVSAAIAMALNPKLRIMLVREGALLDSDSLELLAELAAENEFQVLVETVDSSGKVGIVIADGEVAAVNPPRARAKKSKVLPLKGTTIETGN